VVAGSIAISGGSTLGIGLGGAGSDASNMIGTWVQAAIDGSGSTGISASNISLIADDTSKIRHGKNLLTEVSAGPGPLSTGRVQATV